MPDAAPPTLDSQAFRDDAARVADRVASELEKLPE